MKSWKFDVGRIKLVHWNHAWRHGVRGAAASWNGKRFLLSFEIHYERRQP